MGSPVGPTVAAALLVISTRLCGGQMMQGNMRGKVQMGVKNQECDDGESNLEVDWLDDPRNYTCYHPDNKFLASNKRSSLSCDNVPPNHFPAHFCMNKPLTYPDLIPTFADHRPIWPVFGEYKFVPVQRWLHNIEHGAVVMLYHPCTHHTLVHKLRKLVTGCIRKHVITPYHLPEDQPLALVAWGCRLQMSSVDEEEVVNFIRQHGLKGPEGDYPKEGQYTYQLIKKAVPPPGSDLNDSVLCPRTP